MKKLITLLQFSFLILLNVQGQVLGDFRSKTSGIRNWNDYNAWETYNGTTWIAATSGKLPTVTNAVEIKVGDTIIVNAPSLVSGNLTVKGVLTYHTTLVGNLTVSGSVIVTSSGRFMSPSTGNIVTHFLQIGGTTSNSSIGGNLRVDGIFNMNLIPSSGVPVIFVGKTNNTISGSGYVNFYTLAINKGNIDFSFILEVLSSTIIAIPDATSTIANRLILTCGTFKLSSASSLKPFYASSIIIPANAKIWLNNASANIQSVGAGTTLLSGGTFDLFGSIQIDAGTFSYGFGNSNFNCRSSGIIKLGSLNAVLNIYGCISAINSVEFIMTDGYLNIYPQLGTNSVPGNIPIFQFNGKSIDFTGGTMTIMDPNPNSGSDLAIDILSGTCNFTGSTLCFGNGISDLNGTSNGFIVNAGRSFLGNVVINNSSASINLTRIVKLNKSLGIAGNLIINSGIANQFLLNGFALTMKGNIFNSGNLVFDNAINNVLNLVGTTQQIVTGSGTFSSAIDSLTINNTSGINPSVDLQIPLTVTKYLSLIDGSLDSSNGATFTIGNLSKSTKIDIIRSGGSLALTPTYAFGGVSLNNVCYNTPVEAGCITTGNELPPGIPVSFFTVNNPGGVILDKSVSCGMLVLKNGILTSTSQNFVKVTGTNDISIEGGKATSYVNGPLTRTIPSMHESSNYFFPIGKLSYTPFEFQSFTTDGTGNCTITVEAFDNGPYPGTPGTGLSSINKDKYWSLSAVLGNVTIGSTTSIQLTDSGLTGTNRIGQSATETGIFNNVGGTMSGEINISSVNPINYSTISSGTFFRIGTATAFPAGIYAIGPSRTYQGYAGIYSKLSDAINAISFVPLAGNIIFEFQTDYLPSLETYPVDLSSNIVSSESSTIIFRPAASVNSAINFSFNGTVIDNAGADYILFDGRNGGNGTNQFLQFTNTAQTNALSTVLLSNDALYNRFLYCSFKGSTQTANTGIITINTPSSGNNFYTIDHCSFNGNGTANNCLYILGKASNGIITNNNFFDYRNGAGINLTGGSSNVVIDSNSFYQKSPYVGFSGTTSGIIVSSSENVQISNNNIGGSSSGLFGTWTVSASTPASYNFTGINATSLATTSRIYNNKIQNFDWKSNVSTWTGINVSGSVNVGTDGANYIGNDIGNDNIKVTYYSTGSPSINGILAGGAANIENNIIGSFNSQLSGTTTSGLIFCGINSSGTGIINHNIVGSATTENSILITGTGTSAGIIHSYWDAINSSTVDNNIIANICLTNTSDTPTFIALNMNGGIARKNSIFNIGSSFATSNPIIYGINNANGITSNEFSNNTICLNGGMSTNPSLFGFYNSSTKATAFYYNSISLYGVASGNVNTYAFNRTNYAPHILNNNILINSRTGGTGIHYAIFTTSITDLTSDYNDLYVAGTTLGHFGATGVVNDKTNITAWRATTNQDAYSINADPLFTSQTNLLPLDTSPVLGHGTPVSGITTDITNTPRSLTSPTIGAYEIVCTNPTNGGTIAADQEIWNTTPELLTSIDPASGYSGTLEYKWQCSVSPFTSWIDIPNTNASTYQPGLIDQTTKFKRLARTSCMSTWEGAVESNIVTISVAKNKWRGIVSNNWNDPANWTQNIVPSSDADIIFDDTAQNDCQLNSDLSVNDITNNQSMYRLILNGKILSIKGTLNSNQTAFIDASSSNSGITFTGEAAQTIPSDVFENNKVYNMTIDNSTGVTLNTDLTVMNLLSINSNKKLIIPTERLLNVTGTINNNAGTSGLIIKASPDGSTPNGSFIFHNASTEENLVPATVEMYTKASYVNGSYKWQFFGIPLKSIQAYPAFNGSYVREMHENVTGTTNHWIQLQNESVLTSFTGYEITQEAGKVICFKGYLENADYGPVSLTYTPEATYKGQHLIGNPYTAAINIKNTENPANSLTFGDGMDKTVYLYNTGSKDDWAGNGSYGGGDSNSAGQYLAVPQEYAGSDLLPPSIPSMQAFLVMINNPGPNATISIPYNSVGTVVKNTTLHRAPATEKVYTRIDVNSFSSGDRMWIFSEPTCTRSFDNGWDGYKLFGSNLSPQLYATEADGYYQVNSIDDINNSCLGFKAGTDTAYTLIFTHHNLSTLYQKIYLTDLNENKTVDITATGSQYGFNANSGEQNDNRFRISVIPNGTDIPTEIKSNNDYHAITVFSSKNAIMVNNRSNLKGRLNIYDMTGRFIQKLQFDANTITTLTVHLPAGSYIIKAITLAEEITTYLIFRK